MNWLAKNHPEMVKRNIENIPYMGRWDDLYCLVDTPCEKDALELIKRGIEEGLRELDNVKMAY